MADELDDQFERSLAKYCAVEPLAGLEDRILRKVRGSPLRRRKIGWLWTVAITGLAVVMLTTEYRRSAYPEMAPLSPRSVESPRPIPVSPPSVLAATAKRRTKRRRALPLARPSEEEMLLARYVAADPEGAVRAFAELDQFAKRDLSVPPIVIAPIKIEALQ